MRKLISLILIFIIVFFIFSASKVSAKVLSNDQGTVTVAKGEVINDDLFVSAQTAEINGIVNGDVFVGAQAVSIPGTVNGNVHIGARSVSLEGSIKGNIYLIAQNITMTGANIGGSIISGSQDLTIDNKTIIGGSVLAGGASVRINSQIKRNVYVGAGTLSIGDNTVIGKDLYYAANQGQANISTTAKIGGTIHKAETQNIQKQTQIAQKQVPVILKSTRIVGAIVAYLGALIIGFLYLKFFGKHLTKTTGLITGSFWKSLGVGFLATIAFIPGVVILLITVVGIPIAGLAFLILLIYVYFAKIVVGSALGNWVVKKFSWKTTAFGAFAIGLVVIYILRLIPYVNGLVGLVVLWTGLGALILSSFSEVK